MQCFTELIPPTAVTHAVALSLLGPKSNNLVVAKTSLLQVFDVRHSDSSSDTVSDAASSSKLVLTGEYLLSGTITSLAAVASLNTKSNGDALLISFRDAKLSLVEWDPENHRINTVSIHYYEGSNVIAQPFGPDLSECESILVVDPSSRCAALKFGARHLAILPFRQTGDELVEGGEDGYDADMGDAEPAPLARTQSRVDETGVAKQTPYKASFVLPLTALDPALTHPVHLAFLHEYREPTFGILSASKQPSDAMLEERKDVLSYTVFTLDLEQRASTNLISIQKLPSDLFRVVPLPLPVGGALLVGNNEFIHVDQGGKTNAVAVNEFAKLASDLSMTNQAELNMKLENCEVESLDPRTGDLLIVLDDGRLATLSFKIMGRNVNGLAVAWASESNGTFMVEAAPSCVAALKGNKIFVGSEDGDSALLGWSRSTSTLSRKRSHAQMLGHDAEQAEEDGVESDDDDDLYATAEPSRSIMPSSQAAADASTPYRFEISDSLFSLGPIHNTCLGRSKSMSQEKLEMVATMGRKCASRLAFISKEIVPNLFENPILSDAKDVWSLRAEFKSLDDTDSDPAVHYDNMLFVYNGEITKVYDIAFSSITSAGNSDQPRPTERTGTEFEHDGETVSMGTLANGSRIVQCRRNEVRTYDASDLALNQIIPMMDEETDAELRIEHTCFCEPYLLVLRDDSTVQILKADTAGDLEPLESEGLMAERKWLSACIYAGALTQGEAAAFLLGGEGAVHVFSLPDLRPVYTLPTLPYLNAVIHPDAPQRRIGTKETLTELLVADLGTDAVQLPFLVLRNAMDDLTLYEPFRYDTGDSESNTWTAGLRFRKAPFLSMPKFDDSATNESDGPRQPLRSIRVGKHLAIYVPGRQPSFILKEPCAHPKLIPLRLEDAKNILPLRLSAQPDGFSILKTDGSLVECALPPDLDFSTGWSLQKVALGRPAQEVRHIAFHAERGMYVVASCRDVDFYFSEEDGRHHEQDDISLRPQVPQYAIQLLSANTHELIHTFDLPYLETVTSLEVMPLEVSEHTHEQELMVVAGTAAFRGEDMPAKGAVSVFKLLDVVPEPDRPETGVKLHLIAREETKGAITAVEAFPFGFIGTAQGQKIMVRGLKEDGSCLPVAFLDGQCHTTQLKMLPRTGMWLAGDAWKGLWFGGFIEEPYKLSVLGKAPPHMEVMTAEFLPADGHLYIVIMDANMDLHVLQYDPENPKSLSGSRLLHRSTFHVGQYPTSMTLLPSTLTPKRETLTNGDADNTPPPPEPLHQILATSQTGSISLITPLDEPAYRRLGALQAHLTSVLEHAAGLNPRAYRAVETEGAGGRGIVDGSILLRIGELGSARRAEVLGRAGMDGWGLRSDLEVLRGGGLGFL